MRVLFATGESYLPGRYGGAELSVDELARELGARGHACEVVAKLGHGGARLRHRIARAFARGSRWSRRDLENGYPTHRALPGEVRAAVLDRVRTFRPDAVLAWNAAAGELADDVASEGVRAIVWVPDVTMRWAQDGRPREPSVRLAGASGFVARRIRETLGRPADVLLPCVRLEACRAPVRRPEFVTLVNPRVAKGVDVAFDVAARLPDRRFLFVAAGGLPRAERAAFAARRRAARNVEVCGAVPDVRDVYARTAVLLVPSQCEDASPRVVLEAHANGIPVVASDVGGIPEVGGGACVLLPPDAAPVRWAAEVERLLADPVARDDAARRSLANAARPEFRAGAVADAFLRLAGAPEAAGALA